MTVKNTILVVEDERPLLDAIKTKLEKNGLSVITARNVEQAIELLGQNEKISAVWLDHYLIGKESGLDFVAKVKDDSSKWKEIPVFVVSNTAGPDKVRSYMRLGVKKYYTKSEFRLDQVVQDIKQYISRTGAK